MPLAHVDASRTNRSLAAAAQGPTARPQLEVELPLLLYRKMLDSAVADAKRTRCGMPTNEAILSRYWIEAHHPKQSDRDEWQGSFDCCCHFLQLQTRDHRRKVLAEIDAALALAAAEHMRTLTYRHRAVVLSCHGVPTALGKQFMLALMSEDDWEQLTMLDRPDPPKRKSKHAPKARR